MTRVPPFNPLVALHVLDEHAVRFVLVGGFAGRLLGSPSITNDLGICPDSDRGNLDRLAAALRAMNARLRGVDDDLPFLLDGETLSRADSFTFTTDHGAIDVLRRPSGTTGYVDLMRAASELELGETRISVVDIDDLIRMKQAAGRPKDRIEVEVLKTVRAERRRLGGEGWQGQ